MQTSMPLRPPTPLSASPRITLPLAALFGGWLALAVIGSVALISWSSAPAAPSEVVERWPSGTSIPAGGAAHGSPVDDGAGAEAVNGSVHRNGGAGHLLMFAHPHCVCTRASLEELLRALTASVRAPDVTIVITLPPGTPENWHNGHLWRTAMAAGLPVRLDHDGAETRRFGVRASGHVLLYRSDGTLAFSGGITPSRGHEGPNHGRSALIQLLSGQSPAHERTPVYGCPLLDDDQCTNSSRETDGGERELPCP